MPSRHPTCIARNPIVPRARRSRSTEEIVEREINVGQMKEKLPEATWVVTSHLGSAVCYSGEKL
jgi:hypothetical protein